MEPAPLGEVAVEVPLANEVGLLVPGRNKNNPGFFQSDLWAEVGQAVAIAAGTVVMVGAALATFLIPEAAPVTAPVVAEAAAFTWAEVSALVTAAAIGVL